MTERQTSGGSRLLDLAGQTRLRPVIARTTQFHDFAAQSLRRGKWGPLVFVPAMRIQPVDLAAVARHLVDLAEHPDMARAPDLAGPRMESLPDLVRRYRVARGLRGWVVPVPFPGGTGQANRAGGLLPHGGITDDTSFDDWLARESTAEASRAEGRR